MRNWPPQKIVVRYQVLRRANGVYRLGDVELLDEEPDAPDAVIIDGERDVDCLRLALRELGLDASGQWAATTVPAGDDSYQVIAWKL